MTFLWTLSPAQFTSSSVPLQVIHAPTRNASSSHLMATTRGLHIKRGEYSKSWSAVREAADPHASLEVHHEEDWRVVARWFCGFARVLGGCAGAGPHETRARTRPAETARRHLGDDHEGGRRGDQRHRYLQDGARRPLAGRGVQGRIRRRSVSGQGDEHLRRRQEKARALLVRFDVDRHPDRGRRLRQGHENPDPDGRDGRTGRQKAEGHADHQDAGRREHGVYPQRSRT